MVGPHATKAATTTATTATFTTLIPHRAADDLPDLGALPSVPNCRRGRGSERR